MIFLIRNKRLFHSLMLQKNPNKVKSALDIRSHCPSLSKYFSLQAFLSCLSPWSKPSVRQIKKHTCWPAKQPAKTEFPLPILIPLRLDVVSHPTGFGCLKGKQFSEQMELVIKLFLGDTWITQGMKQRNSGVWSIQCKT